MNVVAKEFSVSTVFGMCCGVAVKRLTRDAMYGVGLGVIGLQVLSYLGYVDINWHAVEKDLVRGLDQDGDGKLTVEDVKVLKTRLAKFLSTGMPNAAGFCTGMCVGIKIL